MTDIVERLRADARGGYAQYWRKTAAEAAAEIERLHDELADVRADAALLRAEIERLRATIAYMEDHADSPTIIRREARRALEPKP